MVSAEEDAASDAGFAGISEPFVDVVCFAEVWGALTAVGSAAAVSGGQSDALPVGVVALFASDVDDVSVGVEGDGDGAGVAGDALGDVHSDADAALPEQAAVLGLAAVGGAGVGFGGERH